MERREEKEGGEGGVFIRKQGGQVRRAVQNVLEEAKPAPCGGRARAGGISFKDLTFRSQ